MLNISLGIAIQTSLVALPIYIVLMRKNWIIFLSVLLVLLGTIMKKTWWNKLKNADN
jgi:hypothetical protein